MLSGGTALFCLCDSDGNVAAVSNGFRSMTGHDDGGIEFDCDMKFDAHGVEVFERMMANGEEPGILIM